MKKKFPNKGFTLIELMIVVVIIGILATMAIPKFLPMAVKSKQQEAKMILKNIYTMERSHRQAGNSYWGAGRSADSLPANQNNFDSLGVLMPAGSRYQYSIITANSTNLTIRATATGLDDDASNDIWEINEMGTISCITNDVIL